LFEVHIGKDGFLDGIRIVCANADADVNGISHNDGYWRSRNQGPTSLSGERRELIAPALNSKAGRAMLC
jgi:hypothetical protein